MPSAILHANPDNTLLLIDIPLSIALAQGPARTGQHLLSSPPLKHLLQTNEPRSNKARAKVRNHEEDANLHAEIAGLVTEGLVRLREMVGEGVWCLERAVIGAWENGKGSAKQRKRKRGAAKRSRKGTGPWEHEEEQHPSAEGASKLMVQLSTGQGGDVHVTPRTAVDPSDSTSTFVSESNQVYHNPTPRPLSISLLALQTSVPKSYIFTLPPHSITLLSAIPPPSQHTSPSFLPDPIHPYPLLLLDPPWPNRSVNRSTTYHTPFDIPTLQTQLLAANLPSYLTPNALVAVWITNKAAARRCVLGPGGLFENWGVRLIEEWVWVKITAKGECVVPVEGLWRKGWECLLVGRRCGVAMAAIASAANATAEEGEAQRIGTGQGRGQEGKASAPVRRRLIFAVPDLHSRKPCLKAVFERVFPQDFGAACRALECYARYSVEGWTSWGDEAMLFNWDGYWSDAVGTAR